MKVTYCFIFNWLKYNNLDGMTQDNGATAAVSQGPAKSRSFRGIKSDYDYRQWSVERLEQETERVMKMMQTTYDQVSDQCCNSAFVILC